MHQQKEKNRADIEEDKDEKGDGVTFLLINVVVAPVSTSRLVWWLLTRVMKKINEVVDGFDVLLSETTPSVDGSATRNLDKSSPHDQVDRVSCLLTGIITT